MKNPRDIILAPIISEKSMAGVPLRKYSFKVATDAEKVEIARACEELFEVKVAKVNTMNVSGQFRRQGRYGGYTAAWKKAIITLTPDSKKIQFFESMT